MQSVRGRLLKNRVNSIFLKRDRGGKGDLDPCSTPLIWPYLTPTEPPVILKCSAPWKIANFIYKASFSQASVAMGKKYGSTFKMFS